RDPSPGNWSNWHLFHGGSSGKRVVHTFKREEDILMSSKATVTVLRPREEVERLWRDPQYRPDHIDQADAVVHFVDAPGDRGTEIHVELAKRSAAGKLGEAVQKLTGTEPLAKAKDDL